MLWPGPKYLPVVVALIPTNGKDDVAEIHALHMTFWRMAEDLDISVLACSGDSVASELKPLTYDYLLYGVHVKAPIFKKTGPLNGIQDPPHGQKTSCNQPQHGTKTSSLGNGCLINRSLMELYETGESGLMWSDVVNVNKQDDGAAHRFYHPNTLRAATQLEGGVRKIIPKFKGLFAYDYILGTRWLYLWSYCEVLMFMICRWPFWCMAEP